MGETYRADAKTWVEGIKSSSGYQIETYELPKNERLLGHIALRAQHFAQGKSSALPHKFECLTQDLVALGQH